MKISADQIAWGSTLPAQVTRLLEEDFVTRRDKRPVYFPQFASTSLPDPAAWLGANIYVTDKGCNAVSNGVAWVRPDGSAL